MWWVFDIKLYCLVFIYVLVLYGCCIFVVFDVVRCVVVVIDLCFLWVFDVVVVGLGELVLWVVSEYVFGKLIEELLEIGLLLVLEVVWIVYEIVDVMVLLYV